jgi:4-amino-4-deoxy-L-arabinose transferase-like glycosyltransferase
MAQPDGSALGIPVSWPATSPFPDYLAPGILLSALGLLYGFAAFLELRRASNAWFWAGMSGGAMIVWIIVQAAFMGYDRHPIETALQATVLTIGLVTGALAFMQMRMVKRHGAPIPRSG